MLNTPRVGERRLSWMDRIFYLLIFALFAWILFGLEVTLR